MSTIKVDTTTITTPPTMTSIQPNSTTTRNNSSVVHHYRSFSDGFDNDIRSGSIGVMRRKPPPSTTTTATTTMHGRRCHSTLWNGNNSATKVSFSAHDETAATTATQTRRDIIETQRQYRRLYNPNNNKIRKYYNNNINSSNIFRSDYNSTNTGSHRIFPTAILSRPSSLNTNTPAEHTFNTNATVIAPILSLLNEDIDTDQRKVAQIVKELDDSKWLQQYPAAESRYSFATGPDDIDTNPSQVISTFDPSLSTGDGSTIDVFAAVEAICSTYDITELCRTTRNCDSVRAITKSTIVFPSTDNWISGLLSNVIIPRGNPWETTTTAMTLDQLSSMENAGMYHYRLTSLMNGQEEYMGELLRLH